MEKLVKNINDYFKTCKYDFDYEIDENIIYYNISFGSKLLKMQLEYSDDEEHYVQVYMEDSNIDFGTYQFKEIDDFIAEFEESVNHFRSYLRCIKKVYGLLEEIKECIDEANIGIDSEEVELTIKL